MQVPSQSIQSMTETGSSLQSVTPTRSTCIPQKEKMPRDIKIITTAVSEKQKQNKKLIKSKEEFPRASDNPDLEEIILKCTHGKFHPESNVQL